MTLNTFNPSPGPSPGTSRKYKAKLKRAEFGDGYTQVTRDGLNHLRRTVTLHWEVLTAAQADAIEDFIVDQGGDIPFYYTVRGDVQRKWTSDLADFERTHGTPNTITLTLTEDFSLLS